MRASQSLKARVRNLHWLPRFVCNETGILNVLNSGSGIAVNSVIAPIWKRREIACSGPTFDPLVTRIRHLVHWEMNWCALKSQVLRVAKSKDELQQCPKDGRVKDVFTSCLPVNARGWYSFFLCRVIKFVTTNVVHVMYCPAGPCWSFVRMRLSGLLPLHGRKPKDCYQ